MWKCQQVRKICYFSKVLYPKIEIQREDDVPLTRGHQLLLKAGYIHQNSTGHYTLLHFASRVIEKICHIVTSELDAIGSSRISMPIVQPKALWQSTNRWELMGAEMMTFSDRKKSEFCLAPTHEECITSLLSECQVSYRNLPLRLYQIGPKFRDEMRPRHGLVRGREFLMKDLYSFDVDQRAAFATYDIMLETYKSIFYRLGLPVTIAEADTGAIGGTKSHEFQVVGCEAGEDTIVGCPCGKYVSNLEKAIGIPAKSGAASAADDDGDDCSYVQVDGKSIVKIHHNVNRKTLNYVAISKYFGGKSTVGWNPKKSSSSSSETFIEHVDAELFDISCPSSMTTVPGVVQEEATRKQLFTVVQPGDLCETECCKGKPLKFSKGLEVGHLFYLGTRYSSAIRARYSDDKGRRVPLEMGCFGLGISRILQAIAEIHNDEKGINWGYLVNSTCSSIHITGNNNNSTLTTTTTTTKSHHEENISPYRFCVIPHPNVTVKEATILIEQSHVLCGAPGDMGHDVIIDDRDGKKIHQKVNDALLIGFQYVILLFDNHVELLNREGKVVSTADKIDNLLSLL